MYSELTDSLPDLFWDSKHELNLENYYDQVGRALDVGIRIKVLNEKMDYAQEIARVLRETLSERHGTFLEWTIIVLIAIEVGFEVLRLEKERFSDRSCRTLARLRRQGPAERVNCTRSTKCIGNDCRVVAGLAGERTRVFHSPSKQFRLRQIEPSWILPPSSVLTGAMALMFELVRRSFRKLMLRCKHG